MTSINACKDEMEDNLKMDTPRGKRTSVCGSGRSLPCHGLVTPQDILSMAQYYHIDLSEEPFLLPVLKQAVETPLPPNWKEEVVVEEGPNERTIVYRNEITHETQACHPADSYFKSQIQRSREEGDPRPDLKQAWLRFETEKGEEYYYDFLKHEITYERPKESLRDEAYVDDLSLDAAATISMIRLHNTSEKLTNELIANLEVLCFSSWWNESTDKGMKKHGMDLYFHIQTKHFQVIIDKSDKVYTISHIVRKHSMLLEAWDLHVGAVITVLGRKTTLMKASLVTMQWLELFTKRFNKTKEALESELKKYDSTYVTKQDVSKKSTNFRDMKGKGATSLRSVLGDIERLRDRLAEFRPTLANKIAFADLNLMHQT